jgi:hypothetical protein
MAATGSFHSVNSLALGSGPCRECFGKYLRAESEQQVENVVSWAMSNLRPSKETI